MENPKQNRKPRREVWWLDQDATNHSLKSIGRCFEDRLNWSLLSTSNSLLRHIRSPKDKNLRRSLHQCPGYLREEITLTCDLSKSAIVSHAFPDLSERCSACHQLVQYTHSESPDYNSTISYYRPTPNNSLSIPPTEGALMFDHMPQHYPHLPYSHPTEADFSVGEALFSRRYANAKFALEPEGGRMYPSPYNPPTRTDIRHWHVGGQASSGHDHNKLCLSPDDNTMNFGIVRNFPPDPNSIHS